MDERAAHVELQPSEVTRRLRIAIEAARREAAEHRRHVDEGRRHYEALLERAKPVFVAFQQALRSEGLLFTLSTPASGVRLESERSRDNYIELSLDAARRPVAAVVTAASTRGQRIRIDEHVLAEAEAIGTAGPEDVLECLLKAVVPFIER
jgi:hypothetical protein